MCGPKPPDPKETAAAQTGSNVSTAVANAWLNSTNQVGPDGSVKYRQIGTKNVTDGATGQVYEVPRFEQRTRLSEHGRNLKSINNGTEINVAGMARDQSAMLKDHLGRPISLDGLPAAGDAGAITDGETTRSRVEQALLERMQPSLTEDRENLRAELSNQGIKLGSTAYDRGFDEQNRRVNDARMSAILGAGQEATRVTDMDLAKFNAANTARDRGLSERMAMRNQPINEITALLSGAQVSQPQFGATPVSRIPTTDYAGLANANYQARAGQSAGLLGGIFGAAGNLGSAAIFASDERVKEGVEKIGNDPSGLPVYSYRYKGRFDDGDRHVGFMAQDVEKVKPGAVLTGRDGVKRVDYAAAMGG